MMKGNDIQLFQKILNLCKRRGFFFQSYEIDGGIKGCYSYGPLGAELKRNIANAWWRDVVQQRQDVMGLDTSITTTAKSLAVSGHLDCFNDRLVECRLSGIRFRADKAPAVKLDDKQRLVITSDSKLLAKDWLFRITTMYPGLRIDRQGKTIILYPKKVNPPRDDIHGSLVMQGIGSNDVSMVYRGYACPDTNSVFLTEEKEFNLLFKTHYGHPSPMLQGYIWVKKVDEIRLLPTEEAVTIILANKDKPKEIIQEQVLNSLAHRIIYLRPETAQGTFMQLPAVIEAMKPQLPFGLAQIGKSFRNEISPEKSLFRSLEFEQMELEYFCSPKDASHWFSQWVKHRLDWWRHYARNPFDFTEHSLAKKDLPHYAKDCTDLQYAFPWGLDEIESIANRTDFDLRLHTNHSPDQAHAFHCPSHNGETCLPYVIEPASGLTRAVLAFLCDAFSEETRQDGKGKDVIRTGALNFKQDLISLTIGTQGKDLMSSLRGKGLVVTFDTVGSIGRRYARHDDIGTPCCITIDKDTLTDGTVTLRDRDTTKQTRVLIDDVADMVAKIIAPGSPYNTDLKP